MTFSIVACDLNEQAWGVAVASRFPAVGAVVPWARAGSGAVATQSFANTAFGPGGLDLMASGLSAESTLAQLLHDDPGREQRQVGLVDSQGGAATHTGGECNAWAGGLCGRGYAIQGNILAGPQVIEAMERTLHAQDGQLPARLHAALLAGDRAGGDRRGRQSAAIYVAKPAGGYGGHNDRWIDYRVDDHPDPVARLAELLELHELYFGKSPEAGRTRVEGQVFARLQQILLKLGYLKSRHASPDRETRDALRDFIGNENFEERADPDLAWIDAPVLDFILRKFGE